MRRRLLSLCAVLCMALVVMAEGKAKYVFYFIGDGMGVNQVNGTETYMAAVEGRIGTSPLCFAQFPYVGLVTTYSGTNGVTDCRRRHGPCHRKQNEKRSIGRQGRLDHPYQ